MTLSKRIATLFFAAFMFSLVGCASTEHHEGTGEYIDDSVITTKVKTAILGEPTLKATDIHVETYKGTVQLSGFVASTAAAAKAAEVARGVKGVQAVKNDLRLK